MRIQRRLLPQELEHVFASCSIDSAVHGEAALIELDPFVKAMMEIAKRSQVPQHADDNDSDLDELDMGTIDEIQTSYLG